MMDSHDASEKARRLLGQNDKNGLRCSIKCPTEIIGGDREPLTQERPVGAEYLRGITRTKLLIQEILYHENIF